jgi:RHS repeat-associated protein
MKRLMMVGMMMVKGVAAAANFCVAYRVARTSGSSRLAVLCSGIVSLTLLFPPIAWVGVLYSPKASAIFALDCQGPPLPYPYDTPGSIGAPGSAFCKTVAASDCAADPSSQQCYLETQYARGIVCTNYTVFPPTGCAPWVFQPPVFSDPNAGRGASAYHTDGASIFAPAPGSPTAAPGGLSFWQSYMGAAASNPTLTLNQFTAIWDLNQPGLSVSFDDNSPSFDAGGAAPPSAPPVDSPNDYTPAGPGTFPVDYPSALPLPGLDPVNSIAVSTTYGSGDSNSATASSGGEPINLATGNVFEVQRDFMGLGAFPARFVRFYNSLMQASNFANTELGSNWRGSYDSAVTLISGQSVPTAVVVRPDGQSLAFTNPSGNQWVPQDSTVRAVLRSLNDASGNLLGWTYVTADDVTETYNAAGQLATLANRAGLTQTLTYSPGGQLMSVSDPYGRQLLFAYNAQGQLSQLTDPAGGIYRYAYDANNNLVSVTYPDKAVRQYVYENSAFPNALTGLIDENGSRFVTWTYDGQGRAIGSVLASGVQPVSITYNADGSSSVTDARGTVRQHTFLVTSTGAVRPNGTSVQSCTTSCPSLSSTVAYDVNGVFTSGTDPIGNTTAMTYNSRGLLASRTEAAGTTLARTVGITWHPTYHLPLQITYPDRTISFTYDAGGNRTSQTVTASGVSRTWTYAYNAQGQLTQFTGPRTDVPQIWKYSYDSQGNLSSIQDPLGHLTKFLAYDAYGHPLSMVDPNGVTSSLTFDARGRLTSRSVAGRTWNYQRDAAGQVIGITYPNGATAALSYDAAHRLTDAVYGLGVHKHRVLTAAGDVPQVQLLDATNTVVRQQSFVTDGLGRVTSTTDANGHTRSIAYDSNGRPTNATDALGHQSSLNYDALNRPVAVNDALGNVSSVQYDIHNQPIQVTAANGAITQYQYDTFGELIQESSPDRGNSTITYTAAGLPATRTDARGVVASLSFDVLNRLTRIRYATPAGAAPPTPGNWDIDSRDTDAHPEGDTATWIHDLGPSTVSDDVSYAYDRGTGCTYGIGRLCQREDQSGTEQYAYDAFGDVTQQTHAILGFSYSTQYSYDTAGQLVQEIYPDGRSINYTRDVLERIASVQGLINGSASSLLSTVQYRADGTPSSLTFGNGTTETRGYDPIGRLISQVIGTADSRSYGFDAAGNMTAKQTNVETDQFTYDALNRLTGEGRVQGPSTSNNGFAYDPNGNRLSETRNGVATLLAYGSNSNRLLQIGSQTLRLDAAGNTTADNGGTRTFYYSPAGRLQRIAEHGLPIAAYLYNGLGQRTEKITRQGISLYHYDVFGRLISETTDGSQPSRDYAWADGVPIAQINHWVPLSGMLQRAHCSVGADGKIDWVTYLHTDGLGTPRIGTDVAQTVVWRDDGEAFGESTPTQSVSSEAFPVYVNLRNPGQYFDQETGLFYNWGRYYNPQTGRYISHDPIGLRGGFNPYAYVGNSPLLYIDPSGLVCVWCEAGSTIIGGVLIGSGLLIEAPIAGPALIAAGVLWEIGTGIYAGYEAYSSFNESLQNAKQNENNALDNNSPNTQGAPVNQPPAPPTDSPSSPPSPPAPPNACPT